MPTGPDVAGAATPEIGFRSQHCVLRRVCAGSRGIRHAAQSVGDDSFEPERADGTRRGSLASPDFLRALKWRLRRRRRPGRHASIATRVASAVTTARPSRRRDQRSGKKRGGGSPHGDGGASGQEGKRVPPISGRRRVFSAPARGAPELAAGATRVMMLRSLRRRAHPPGLRGCTASAAGETRRPSFAPRLPRSRS